jgi:hypothetical protein
MKDKSEVIAKVRSMLADVFAAKAQGESYERLARAHGYVDGYMRALLELRIVSRDELVAAVNAEREREKSGELPIRGVSDVAAA